MMSLFHNNVTKEPACCDFSWCRMYLLFCSAGLWTISSIGLWCHRTLQAEIGYRLELYVMKSTTSSEATMSSEQSLRNRQKVSSVQVRENLLRVYSHQEKAKKIKNKQEISKNKWKTKKSFCFASARCERTSKLSSHISTQQTSDSSAAMSLPLNGGPWPSDLTSESPSAVFYWPGLFEVPLESKYSELPYYLCPFYVDHLKLYVSNLDGPLTYTTQRHRCFWPAV